jgi:kojibiose phosphorylase
VTSHTEIGATPAADEACPLAEASPTADPSWILVEEGFTLAREHEVESIFAVSNGYVGTRGSLTEGTRLSAPATFVAGVFDVEPASGTTPELVAAPDWFRLSANLEGEELSLQRGEALVHRRVLDMRQGLLWREWRQKTPDGRVTHLRGFRLASLADRHVLLQSVEFTPENYSGRMQLAIRIAPPAVGAEPKSRPQLIVAPEEREHAGAQNAPRVPPEAIAMAFRTPGSGVTIAVAAASALANGAPQELAKRRVELDSGTPVGTPMECWDVHLEIGRRYCLERIVVLHTSRDGDAPVSSAVAHLARLGTASVRHLVNAHIAAWAERWRTADVAIVNGGDIQHAIRFAAYHLIGAANPEDERVSVGARALTGESYKGHVFWDTEIFMLPFYIFTHPPSARALLMYRYHTLAAARAKARTFGYRGALYAWESTDTGEETTPRYAMLPTGGTIEIRTGMEEHHISADVAYAVWQYWQATGDDDFFIQAGAEIMIETARFWASRGTLEPDGRYHIRGVIGPDEYHEGVDDNVFTNLIAQWNLERGAEAARFLAERAPERWRTLVEQFALAPGEPEDWLRLARAMVTGYDERTGLYEQFAGYFGLEDLDLASFEPRTVAMDLLLGAERIRRSRVVKQADVVMALYLLWDRLPREVIERNFRYYEPRTAHGSSLSPSIHALVAARLGDAVLTERYLKQAWEIDLANNMGNAAGGVHAAALGGLWQAVIMGIAGMRLHPGGLAFDPHLPTGWHALRFSAFWHGRLLRCSITSDPLVIEFALEGDGSMTVAVDGGPSIELHPAHGCRIRRSTTGWGAWEAVAG